MKKLFLNDHFILSVIILNSIVIYLSESGINHPALVAIDFFCLAVYIIEMILKHIEFGVKNYWHNGWDRFDGILVILSLPSIITPFVDIASFDISIILTLRLLRILRFFRLFHFFPNIQQLAAGLYRALKQSGIVLFGFLLFVIIFGMINCSLFKDAAPQYFETPLKSIYTAFRIFTVEGWYEIPDAIAAVTSPFIGHLSRFYFCFLLLSFGILGLSFLNSVFVDAMIEDNNDDIKEQLNRLEKKIDALTQDQQSDISHKN